MPPEHKPSPTVAWKIRPFRSADAGTILGILRGSVEAAQWPFDSYAKLANSPGGVLLVCESEPHGPVMGFIAARQVAEEAEILNIAVDPKFRRRGMASALLLAALAEFRRSVVLRVFLELRDSNLTARSLYLRYGFVISGRRKDYYQQPTEDAVCMQTRLAPTSA
jgi:ribosomal-protein-alanine N-acetyltransferase